MRVLLQVMLKRLILLFFLAGVPVCLAIFTHSVFWSFVLTIPVYLIYKFCRMKLIKDIKSKEGVVHFRRWQVFTTPWFDVFIHGIYKSDEDEHMHDHPWDYFSIVIWGKFIEKVKQGRNAQTFLTTSHRKAEHTHKIEELKSKKVYTLFFASKRKREWGYWVRGAWIDNVTYRKLKNEGKLI